MRLTIEKNKLSSITTSNDNLIESCENTALTLDKSRVLLEIKKGFKL